MLYYNCSIQLSLLIDEILFIAIEADIIDQIMFITSKFTQELCGKVHFLFFK